MADSHRPRTRHWTNIAVIVVSTWCLVAGLWGFFPTAMESGTRDVVASSPWMMAGYLLAGILGYSSVFFALRSPALSKVLCVAAGIFALSRFAALDTLTAVAILSVGIPAAVLLGASPFMGPMPTPEQGG